jgi:hypothetical protein
MTDPPKFAGVASQCRKDKSRFVQYLVNMADESEVWADESEVWADESEVWADESEFAADGVRVAADGEKDYPKCVE